jgi:uncharacterized protein YukE
VTRYSGLGFDPTPGNVDSARTLADALADAARTIGDAAGRITHAVGTSDAWQGNAADEFRRRGTALPATLLTDQQAMSDAADALFTWVATLADLQRQAEQHDRRARGLGTRIAQARHLVEEWEIAVSVASTHARPTAEATLAGHQRVLAALQSELDSVLDDARQLAVAHQQAAASTTGRLHAPSGLRTTVAAGIGVRLAELSGLARQASAALSRGAAYRRVDVPTGAAAVALAAAT